MKQFWLILLFLILNFGGLALGNWFMGNAVKEEWYIHLNKAPWTPPGWVFGFSWTVIMICFSIYLSQLFLIDNTKKLKIIFLIQFILNVSWNFIFFNQHLIFVALVNISLLTSLLFIYYFKLSDKLGIYKFLLLPYMLWLCIATSLNLYALIHN